MNSTINITMNITMFITVIEFYVGATASNTKNQSLPDNNQSDNQQSFSHEDSSVSFSLDSDI